MAVAPSSRIEKLQQKLSPTTALLIVDSIHIRYLSGFVSLAPNEREAFLIITKKTVVLCHSSFSPVENSSQIIFFPKNSVRDLVVKLTELQISENLTALHIDKKALFVSEYEELRDLPLQLETLEENWIWELRMHKDSEELSRICKAREITERGLESTVQNLQAGMSEKAVQQLLERELTEQGAEGFAFPTIVAFGDHTALPHHQPTERKLSKETPVLIDCGAKVAGYCADMTRTIWFGNAPDPEFTKIDSLVHQAFDAAKAEVETGSATAQSIDAAARQVISEAGYGQQFIHTTGHGLGLSIHEPPSLSGRTAQLLEPGMVITIEPGIYLAGKFGIRFEETVIT